jgi:hypothetical protein
LEEVVLMKKGSKVWNSTYKKKYDKIIVEKGYPPNECKGVISLRLRVCRKCFDINKKCVKEKR